MIMAGSGDGADMPLQSGAQAGQVEVSVDTAELLAGFDHAGGAPAQCHLPIAPAFDVARVVSADRDHRLHCVRAAQGPGQGGRHPESEHGQGFGHPLTEAGGGAGTGLVKLGGQPLQQRLGSQGGVGVVGSPHPLADQAA